MRFGILFIGGIVFLLSGCSPHTKVLEEETYPVINLEREQSDDERREKESEQSSSETTISNPSSEISMSEKKQYSAPPEMDISPEKTYRAILSTGKGDIVVNLHSQKTPQTVNNFIFLSRGGFYDGVIFHRVIEGFMIQGGDPTGTGSGGPGYRFDDEPFEGSYERGILAMANAGPDTNGSQFFIVQEETSLPPNYVIFGNVIEGMDVVDAIATAPVQMSLSGEKSSPIEPVLIEAVRITEEEI